MKLFSNHPARNFRINKRRGEIPRGEIREIILTKQELKKIKNREAAKRSKENFAQMTQNLEKEQSELVDFFSNPPSVQTIKGRDFLASERIYPAVLQHTEKHLQRLPSGKNNIRSLVQSDTKEKNRRSAEKHRLNKYLLFHQIALKNQELFQALLGFVDDSLPQAQQTVVYNDSFYPSHLDSLGELSIDLNSHVEEWDELFLDFSPA